MKNLSLNQYLKLPYSITVVPDQTTEGQPCYLAMHPELPGCMSHGETTEEAIANLLEARELYLKTLIEKQQNIPLPSLSTISVWKVDVNPSGEAVNNQQLGQVDLISLDVSPIQSLDTPIEIYN